MRAAPSPSAPASCWPSRPKRCAAPGNAILIALEGKAIIGYEGKDYELNAGESLRFDKNGLHSVTPQGKFKMSLLLVIE